MTEQKISDIEKLQRADHDTLTRLEGKVDTLITNVGILQTGTDGRVTKLEAKVALNEQWIHDFNVRYKFVTATVGALGAVIGFAFTVLTQTSHIFK